MAAAATTTTSSKKEKKNKKQGKRTLNLNEFLAGTTVTRTVTSSWADESDDCYGRGPMEPIELPTAPRAARGIDINMDRVPSRAPFTAFIGNLPYEIEDSEVAHFFKDLDIVGIRFPNERLKKYGYVEFADRQTLVTALGMDGQKMGNNLIRVDLAEEQSDRNNDRNRRGFGDRDRGEDFDETRTEGDWRKKDGAPRVFSDRDRDRDRDRDFGDRDRGGFGDRDRDRGGFGDRGFGDRDRDRDRGSFSGSRSGGFDNWDRNRDNKDRVASRDDGWRSFGSGYRDGGSSGRYGDRYGGGRDDRYGYRDRYDRMESRGDDRGPSRDTAPSERPRLKLTPRTKPVVTTMQQQSSSSIFGGARPVDTAAREREIEDRLKRQHELEREKVDQERETRYRLSSSTSERGRHSSQGEDSAPRRERERKSSSSSGKGIRTVAPPPGAGSARIRRDSTLSEPEDVFEEAEKPAPVPEGTSVPLNNAKMSPKEEDAPIPAPPPKENPWGKRAESKPASPPKEETKPTSEPTSPKDSNKDAGLKSPKEVSPKNVQPAAPPVTNAWSKGKPEIIPANPPKENAWAKRSSPSSDSADKENHISKDNGTKDGETGFSGSHWGGNRQRREDVGRGSQPPAKPVREKRERPLPKSIDEMPQYSAKSDKDWSDTNKFSSLMGDEENEEQAKQ